MTYAGIVKFGMRNEAPNTSYHWIAQIIKSQAHQVDSSRNAGEG